MDNKIQIFNYKGNDIAFNVGEHVMVNATEMAKPFGKRPVDWIKTAQAQNFINAFSEVKKITSADLLQVTKGGNGIQGTWMHEDVALEFARWLSPEFAIWCNDRIKELMKYGFTATSQKLDELLSDPDLIIGLATQLKEERERNRELEQKIDFQLNEIRARKEIIKEQHGKLLESKKQNRQLKNKNKKLSKKIEEDESKVNYFNQCAEAADDSLLSFRQTAAILNIKERYMLDVLHYVGVVYFTNMGPMPYASYLNKEYFRVVDGVAENGKYYLQAKLTPDGRKFINDNWGRFKALYTKWKSKY